MKGSGCDLHHQALTVAPMPSMWECTSRAASSKQPCSRHRAITSGCCCCYGRHIRSHGPEGAPVSRGELGQDALHTAHICVDGVQGIGHSGSPPGPCLPGARLGWGAFRCTCSSALLS